MRFTALILPIVFGGASAGPCRPSSSLSSLESTPTQSGWQSTENSLMSSSETTAWLSSTFAVTLSTEQFTDATTTAVPATEITLSSETTSMAESTLEPTAAATSTTAPPTQCRAPGSLQCCQTVGMISNPVISLLLGLLGIVIQDPNTLIGATCSPITNTGTCAATPVCCTDNSHGGLIAISCMRV